MNLRTNVHFFSFFLDKDETFGRIVFPKYRFRGRIFRINIKCLMKESRARKVFAIVRTMNHGKD